MKIQAERKGTGSDRTLSAATVGFRGANLIQYTHLQLRVTARQAKTRAQTQSKAKGVPPRGPDQCTTGTTGPKRTSRGSGRAMLI